MKVLITGTTGYLGHNLVESLNKKYTVMPAPRFSSYKDSQPWISDIESQIIDFKPDAVIVVGASQRPDDSADALKELLFSNVELPARLAKCLIENKSDCLLIVFGSFSQLADSATYRPANLYAATKQACEDVLTHFALRGLKIASVRLFDVFGEDDTRPKLLNLLINSAMTGEAIDISPGDQEIDLIHVLDVVDGVLLIMDQLLYHDPSRGVRIFGLGSGQPMKVRDLIDRVSEQTGRKVKANIGARPYREREIMRVWHDFPTPRGWHPKRSPYGKK